MHLQLLLLWVVLVVMLRCQSQDGHFIFVRVFCFRRHVYECYLSEQTCGDTEQDLFICVFLSGCWVVTGGRDGSLCVWHRASDRLIAKLDDAHAGCLTAVAFQRKNW